MTGQVYEKIQKLIAEGGKGDPTAIENIKTKLMLKGINPDDYSPSCEDCEDTPEILAILEEYSNDLLGRRNE